MSIPWINRLKAAIALFALLGLTACGGGGGGSTPSTAATTSGSATANTNTLVMGVAQTAQIASATANADGSTQLVTTPNSTLGAALTVGSVVQASGGTDARFPLGLVGKVTSVTTGSNGVTTAVLTNATLADVVQKSSSQANEVALDSTNFIGVISPKAVQVSATIPPQTLSVLQQGITVLNGGLVVSEPNSLGRIANKVQSGLSFLGGNGTVDAGKINLTLGVKLADMGLDASRLKPYGKSGKASFDIVGSIKNLKLTENHDFDSTAGVVTGLKSMDMRVTGDIDVKVDLHGGVDADLGYYSQAWKEVESEQFKMLGVSAKLTGLDSKDKVGKYPIAGLVFSVPCSAGCPVLAGQTQTPLREAEAGGVIVWVYLTADGKITLDGEVGAKLNSAHLNLGLQKPEGGQLDVVHELSNTGTGRLIEAPYFDGEAGATLRLGTAIDADFFTLGVRIGNASAFVGGQANATLKTVTPISYGTTKLGDPWTWDGQACLQSSIGAGAIFSATANIGAEIDTWMGKVDGNLTYGGIWPTDEERLIPGWHGIGNLTWYTSNTSSNCFPAPVASKIITTQDALTRSVTITVSGTNLPDDLLLGVSPAANCTGLQKSAASVTSVSFTCQIGATATGLVYNLSSQKAGNIDLRAVANQLNYTATPLYSGIDCGSPAAGQLMTCTVSGTNLPSDLALTATGCANIQSVADTIMSTTQRQFTCTPASQGLLQVSISSAALGIGANYAQSITIGQLTCTPPQVLNQAGVCAAPTTTSKLNDTGITASQCYQAGSDTLVDCGSAGALALNNAQDGMTGRDADPASNSNIDGKLGFSFSAVAGGCVQDNVTGLMWEVKTADGGLRDWHKTYTNYSAAYNPNNQYGAATDASGYVTAVNATSLCGHNDWRLPSADELQSIVDYGVAYPGPTIDASWFPNTQGGWFWSASSYVGYSDYAWGVYFNYGGVNDNNRNVTYAVRLVRAGQ